MSKFTNTVTIELNDYIELYNKNTQNMTKVTELEASVNELTKQNNQKTNLLLESFFKVGNMVYRTREQMVDVEDTYYFGFSYQDKKSLLSLGVTLEKMIEYINKRWDLKEQEDKEELEKEKGEE